MSDSEEFRFRVDNYTPNTMPLERLAEYLEQLAAFLGEPKFVHLVGIDGGSVVPVIRIDCEAAPKVVERTRSVRIGNAPLEAMRAYRAINKLLKEDNATGDVRNAAGAEIIRFPGREEEKSTFPAITQAGSVDGEVIRLGGTGKNVPVILRSEGELISHCYASRGIAKALAQRIFEPVRLFGKGRWLRDNNGLWSLDAFKVARFEVLKQETLSEALATLRSLPSGDWDDDAFEQLREIRYGPKEIQ